MIVCHRSNLVSFSGKLIRSLIQPCLSRLSFTDCCFTLMFLGKWDSWRAPPPVSDYLLCWQIMRDWTLGIYITTKDGTTWHLVLCKCWRPQNKTAQEYKSLHWADIIPRHGATNVSTPPASSGHPFPNSYIMKVFRILLFAFFALPLAQKISQAGNHVQTTAGFAMMLEIL